MGHCRSLVSVANFTSCGFVAFVAKKRKVIKNCKYVPVLRFFGYVCKCKIFAQFSKHIGLDWDSNAVTEIIKQTNCHTLNVNYEYHQKREKNGQSYHQDHTSLTGFNA